jgi:tetratricopeptide (TPR) repeat protein
MMKRAKRTTTILFFLFLPVFLVYALPWKSLHEKADREALTAALAEAVKNPNTPEALYPLGLVYLNMYKINEADGVFLDMLQLNPKSVEAKWGHAEVLRRRHRLDQSRVILGEIVKQNPEFSPASITLGYLLYEKKDYDGAIRLAIRVLKQGPGKVDLSNYVRAYLIIASSKGMIALAGGPFSKLINGMQVLPYLKKAEKLEPESAGVAFGLGSYYVLAPPFTGGDKKKGLGYLEKAVRLDPQFVDVYARLAEFYQAQGDRERYHFYLNKAQELDPENELLLEVEKENKD